MGRQETKMVRPWVTVRGTMPPENTPMTNRTKNQMTRPYRPWVPGMTCRIRHLEKCSGAVDSRPAAASPARPVPRAEPTQQRPTASAAPRKARPMPPNCSRKADMSVLLLNIHIVCLICDGAEGPSAALIEPVEKFQALEPQIVDVAAQQVQREVQGIAQRGDNHKGDHIAGHCPQLVEN